MSTIDGYVPETRGLPKDFEIEPFIDKTAAQLESYGGQPAETFLAVVIGRLLLDGNIDPSRSDFRWAVKRSYDIGVTENPPGSGTTNKEHYIEIARDFRAKRRNRDIKFQEFAAVADHVTAATADWDISDTDSRRGQVEVGMIKYADGTVETGFSSLDLPPIVSEDASSQEIEPTNVQAVAMIAAAYEIEQTGAFDVVDKMLELFTHGMLPVRDDSGGRALNRYFWQAETRLDSSDRQAQYARVLGKGDPGQSDSQPNGQFDQALMRFVSALVRYDNALQVSNVVTVAAGDRLGTSELVRKAGQDLAANASLYGWGFTVFAARKLSQQIDAVFDVLGQETLQRAYGVTGPWQLVERVCAVETGSTPAIVQHRTRAQAIKDLLDLLAIYSSELSRSGGVRRFLPNLDDLRGQDLDVATFNGNRQMSRSTVSPADYESLITAANNLIAVGGITDDELSRMSAPVASAARGSIPVVGGDSGGLLDGTNIDQLRQLASQGQMDQIQRLLGAGSGNGLLG